MHSEKSGPQELNSVSSSQRAGKTQESFGISALTRCLVDAEGNTTSGAGRARRKALGVSALIQFCTLTALLIVPLFATGSRLILHHGEFVPLPPFGGHPAVDPAPAERQIQRSNHRILNAAQIKVPIQQPRLITRIEEATTEPSTYSSPVTISGFRDPGPASAGPPNLFPGNGEVGPLPPRPEPASTPRKPVAVSQGAELARLIHRVEPVYPNFARQTHREGTVELRAIISSDGTVKDLQVLSGDPILAIAARDAVIQWRFRPTMLNGIAVEVVTFITVNFHLGQ